LFGFSVPYFCFKPQGGVENMVFRSIPAGQYYLFGFSVPYFCFKPQGGVENMVFRSIPAG
jgi:hypothetical protein